MKAILRFLPQSLSQRIFVVYCFSLLTLVLAGLVFFYQHQFNGAIDDAYESAALLTEVVAPTITDSVIIGDYDTVQRVLEKILFRSSFLSASFIDVGGGVISKFSAKEKDKDSAPGWLYVLVANRLFDVNHNISAGGRDYGVLRLTFSPEHIALNIWNVTRTALIIGAAGLFFGIALIRISLRSWLGDLERLQTFDWEFQTTKSNTLLLPSDDVPIEIRQTFDVLNRTATNLQVRRARADVTLEAIAEAVITTDSKGDVVYLNPVASRLFHQGGEHLLGRNLKSILPAQLAAVLENGGTNIAGRRVELVSASGSQLVIECSYTLISEVRGVAAGHVLTCRDVTESHLLDLKLRHELDTRKDALDALHEVVKGLKDDDDSRIVAGDDISAVSRFIAELSGERARVTELLEESVKELGNQKSALEEATRRELEIGHAIQRSLLYGTLPGSVEGAWIACFTEPSQGIDGDFYSFRHYHPTCFEVLVGDVMGKGVPAALIGAAIKTAYNEALVDLLAARAGSAGLPTPADIVNRLHQMLTPRLMSLSSFATLALYRFDLQAGTLTYVDAGHPPGLLMRAGAMRIESIRGDNLPIGVVSQELYLQSTINIAPGDQLLLFSDGITEARNDNREEFGLDRLSDLVVTGNKAGLPLPSILHSIRGELRQFSGKDKLIDDQTALMVELRPRRRSPRARPGDRLSPVTFEQPWSLEGLATLRLQLRGAFLRLTTEDAESLILAAHEAATNIIRHTTPDFSGSTIVCRVIYHHNELIVELVYPGESFSPSGKANADFSGRSDGGFGLYIIENSVDQVEYVSPVPGICITRLVKRTVNSAERQDEPR